MSSDFTEHQSSGELQRSKELSLQRTRPPTEASGYEAQRFLGAGAYGEVWVGVDKKTGRRVAIKYYAHRRAVDWSLLSREVEKLVFLSADRYVVQLLDVGWDADPPYYVMEYVENGSLEDLIRREGPLLAAEAVELFREVAVGLVHAHGKGVLHCDLKPANILLDADHRPRLADFGQSRLSHEQRPALGTLFYMAPEQADLQAIPDARWDVYALGAILFCLLTGQPPHRNDDAVGHIDSGADLADRLARYRRLIAAAPPPAEHRTRSDVDRSLAEIIDRCLAPDPNERFANVQEILAALAARERIRARRPLVVLGFAGPLLLLTIMLVFGLRGYWKALDDTAAVARARAAENNAFAAQLAAERVAAEIAGYFAVAREEAEAQQLLARMEAVFASPALAPLDDPQATDEAVAQARHDFLRDRDRILLNEYLDQRLDALHAGRGTQHGAVPFASLFVTDRFGVQLASVFEEEAVSKSIGRNLSHRSYFHGGPVDLPEFHRPQANARHITHTHLSAVFKSNSTQKWKVGITSPIFRRGDAGEEFVGILALTVNLGDFEFFRSTASQQADRFAVLVDGRPGEDLGAILQHPLFAQILARQSALPESLRTKRVPDEIIHGQPGQFYRDPLAGEPEAQSRFDRRWIAAAAPVKLIGNGADTGLVVLVQEDYAAVIRPVEELGARLMREGVIALVVVLLASAALWLFVIRILREPPIRGRRLADLAPEATPEGGNSLPTLPGK